MFKKTILFLALITIHFNQFCAQEAPAQKAQIDIQKVIFFLFIDTFTNVHANGIVQLSKADAKEINYIFNTQDILFVAVIATNTDPGSPKSIKGDTPNLQRHGCDGMKPNQIPRYFPLSVFYKDNLFKKDGDIITLVNDVILDNGTTKKIEFIFILCQHHGLSKKKINIDDLLREYLAKLLKGRCEKIREVESPIFKSTIPGLTVDIEEHEFGLLPSAEMSKLIKAS